MPAPGEIPVGKEREKKGGGKKENKRMSKVRCETLGKEGKQRVQVSIAWKYDNFP